MQVSPSSNVDAGRSSSIITPKASSTMTPSLDIIHCSPSELIDFLLNNRFENDQKKLATFLLEGISLLPEAQMISDELNNAEVEVEVDDDDDVQEAVDVAAEEAKEDEETERKLMGDSIPIPHTSSSFVEISMTNPRAKCHVTFFEGGIICTTTSSPPHKIIIPANSIKHFLIFPKPQDCYTNQTTKAKKASNDMALLSFAEDRAETTTTVPILQFKQKDLSQICFPMPNDDDTTEKNNNQWIDLFCKALKFDPSNVVQVINKKNTNLSSTNSKKWHFSSYHDPQTSSTSGDLPFIKCYHGVNDGVLYPLKEGILFFKPPLYLPRSRLNSIACGRGSDNTSRYVDLVISTDDDSQYEFNNIYREELKGLNNYIHQILIPEMKKDQQQQQRASEDDDTEEENQADKPSTAAAVVQEDDEDDEDEDDEDYEDNSQTDDDDDDDDDDSSNGGIPVVNDVDNGDDDDDATVTDVEEADDDDEDDVVVASPQTKRQQSSQRRSKKQAKSQPSKKQKR